MEDTENDMTQRCLSDARYIAADIRFPYMCEYNVERQELVFEPKRVGSVPHHIFSGVYEYSIDAFSVRATVSRVSPELLGMIGAALGQPDPEGSALADFVEHVESVFPQATIKVYPSRLILGGEILGVQEEYYRKIRSIFPKWLNWDAGKCWIYIKKINATAMGAFLWKTSKTG